MIKLKTLLTETIYSNQAVVYHRTRVEDLANKIYTSGFKPGRGQMYGKAMYSTYELASQERDIMSESYGNIIVKFSVNLTGFMFFDWSEFVKTPLYRQKLQKSTEDTFIQDQISFYNISMEEKFENSSFVTFSSENVQFVYNNSDLIKKVAGVVFTGEIDGKVLACYDVKRLRPIAVKKDGDKEFTKINTDKDFLRKTAIPTAYEPSKKLTRKNYNGTFDILGDLRDNELEKYAKVLNSIRIIEGDFMLYKRPLKNLPDLSKSTVKGNVSVAWSELTTLEGVPMKVEGNFECDHSYLTTLKGAPKSVGGNFSCIANFLTSLENAPELVGGNFWCIHNQLTTLKGAPRVINGNFECTGNKLTTLKGAPKIVNGNFTCSNNPLTSLEGSPKTVGGNFIHSSTFSEDEIRKVCNVKGQIIKNDQTERF
jgi:hypothetical protein